MAFPLATRIVSSTRTARCPLNFKCPRPMPRAQQNRFHVYIIYSCTCIQNPIRFQGRADAEWRAQTGCKEPECFLSNVQPDTCRDIVGLPGVAIRLFALFWHDTSIHVFNSVEFVSCQSTRCRQIDVATDENGVQLCLYSIFTFTSVAFVRAITSAMQTLEFHHPRNNFPRLLDQISILCE